LLCVLLLSAWGAFELARRLQHRLMSTSWAARVQGWRRGLLRAALWAGICLTFLAAAAGLLLGAAYGVSRYDKRMRTMFDLTRLRTKSFAAYANQLVFAERVIFWEAGWGVFNDHPWLGVGLGNSGFFFPEKLSAYAWALTEVRTNLFKWDSLPNSKSLWVRLLAETGLAGTGAYLGWLYLTAASGLSLLRKKGLPGTVGLAAIFALTALLSEGISVDSFALPYLWVSFALAAALASPTPGETG
jgi:O-antigen ligase